MGGFVRFAVLFLFAHFVAPSLSLSRGVCVVLFCSVLFCPPGRSIYGGFLSWERGGGAGGAEEDLHLSTSILSFFFVLFFCFFFLVRFLVFWLKNHPEGFVSLVPLEEHFWGFALCFVRSGSFRSTRDRGEWIPIRGSCS